MITKRGMVCLDLIKNYNNNNMQSQEKYNLINSSGLMTMDEWMDNYRKRNDLSQSNNNNSNNYDYSTSNYLNSLGIQRRTWD